VAAARRLSFTSLALNCCNSNLRSRNSAFLDVLDIRSVDRLFSASSSGGSKTPVLALAVKFRNLPALVSWKM
jgi:hypothetical protein